MKNDGADNPVAQSFYTRLIRLVEEREAKRITASEFQERLNELLKQRAVTAMVPLVAYVTAVGREIGKEKATRMLGDVYNNLSEKWVEQTKKQLNIRGNDALAAKELYWQTLSLWYEDQMIPVKDTLKWEKVPESSAERVHIVDTSWCSILEACKILGLTGKDDYCSMLVPCQMNGFLKKYVNPKLEYYQYKTRPFCDVCEEAIELKE